MTDALSITQFTVIPVAKGVMARKSGGEANELSALPGTRSIHSTFVGSWQREKDQPPTDEP